MCYLTAYFINFVQFSGGWLRAQKDREKKQAGGPGLATEHGEDWMSDHYQRYLAAGYSYLQSSYSSCPRDVGDNEKFTLSCGKKKNTLVQTEVTNTEL